MTAARSADPGFAPDAATARPVTWWWVAICLVVMAMTVQGSRSLWDPDEGRYTAVALQMLESGDFLIPRLNDHQEHLTKPPLTYWALAASMTLFGHNAWAVRLPNALAFVLTGLLVFGLARRFVPERPWLGALVWGSSVITVLAANMVGTDSLLTLFETAAMYAWLRGAQAPAEQGRWSVCMWAALGLAFFTKGPPGLLVLLPVFAFSTATGGGAALRRVLDWRGLLLFALLAFWWFAWLAHARPELIDYFVGHELRDRVLSNVHDRFPQWYGPIQVYGPILGLMLVPWILLGIGWLSGIWRGLRASWWRDCWQRDRDRVLLLLWILLPLLVFCLAKSRLYLYVLPLNVPIALLIARDLSARMNRAPEWPWRALLVLWCIGICGLKIYSSYATSAKDAEQLAAVARRLAPDAERVLFNDVTARYGVRFYLGVPVEQVGKPHTSSLRARGLKEHDLCDEIHVFPRALIVTRGAAMGQRMLPEIPPQCVGISFRSLQPDSGMWLVDWERSTR